MVNNTNKKLGRMRTIFSEFASETWLGIALLLPSLFLISILIFIPAIRAVWLSFGEVSLLAPEQYTFIGLENYFELFGDSQFWDSLITTVMLTSVVVTMEYILGLGFALVLKQKLAGISFFRSISMISWVTPHIVVAMMFLWLTQPDGGLLNIILGFFGVEVQNWFGSLTWALPMISVMFVWRTLPFWAMALMAGMVSIPDRQYEAAKLDGASALQQFRHITFPQISYVSMIMIVLHVIATFNHFQMIYVTTGGGPVGTTETLSIFIYKGAFQTHVLGYAASAAMVMMFLLVIFTAIYVKLEEVN